MVPATHAGPPSPGSARTVTTASEPVVWATPAPAAGVTSASAAVRSPSANSWAGTAGSVGRSTVIAPTRMAEAAGAGSNCGS